MRINLPFLYRGIVRPLLWLVFAGYFLFAVALVALRYAVLPSIDDYRPRIEELAGRMVGAPVSIGHIQAEWGGLHPRLELQSVQVRDANGQTALSLPRVSAIVSWRSLAAFNPRLLQLQLESPELALRRDAQGRYWVGGWMVDPAGPDNSRSGLRWLLTQREIVVRGARVSWSDELRGAPPLVFDKLAFAMRNVGNRHRAALRAEPSVGLAAPLDLRVDFVHDWLSLTGRGDPAHWRGTLYARVDGAELSALKPWVDLPYALEGGGTARAWLGFDHGHWRSGTADVALHGVRGRFGDDLSPLALERLAGRVDVTASASGYKASLVGLDLRAADGSTLAPKQLAAQWDLATKVKPASYQADIAGLDLGLAVRVADSLPLPHTVHKQLGDLRPAGRIETMHAAWQGDLAKPVISALHARFAGLSMAAGPVPVVNDGNHAQRPGFAGLTGTIDASGHDTFRLVLDSSGATLDFPGVFEEPRLAFDQLAAQATVRRDEHGTWHASLARFDFVRPDLRGDLHGEWSSAGRGPSGTLDLSGRIDHVEVKQVHRLIPLVVGAEVRDWLRQALTAGQMTDAEFRVRGDLETFPYANDKSGEFRFAGKFSGLDLQYVPASVAAKGDVWPPLEGLDGSLEFNRAALAVDVRSGRVRTSKAGALQLGRTTARIANLEHDAVLEVNTEVRGVASAFLAFINTSPVGRYLGDALEDASATGNFVVPLALTVPLDRTDDTQARGEVRFAGNELRLAPFVPAMSNMNGAMSFNNHGVEFKQITGTLLDGDFRLSAAIQPDGTNLLQGSGTASAAALTQFWNAPGMARLTGRTPYRASVRLKAGRDPQLLIESDLVGLAIDMPAPLGKREQESWPSRLEWGGDPAAPGKPRQEWIAGGLGEHVNLHVAREFDEAGKLTSVSAAIGVNRAASLQGPGLSISAQMPEVDLDALRKLTDEFVPTPGSEAQAQQAYALPLNRISLSTPRLLAKGRHFDDVGMYAVREQIVDGAQPVDSWRVDIESAQLAGRVSWSDAGPGGRPDRLTARLTRLLVDEQAASEDSAAAATAPQAQADSTVPEIDLVADRFVLFGKELGRLEVLARTADGGREWQLRKLNVKNPDAELDGTGVWKLVAGQGGPGVHTMSLDAVLKLADTGKFLDRMGMHGTMAGGAGTLAAQVSWQGMPYSIDLPSLNGKVQLSLDKGQFLKADPGIAKLLGVLSLQSLPRRVTLDFRDLFRGGFAYDTIRADVAIANGLARTDNFKMNGLSASVIIAGETDLDKETQDLHVVVVPKLDAGAAPLLYALAVNPAIGLSVFLAQLILKDPISQAFAFQYQITGNWTDPQVNKVSGGRGAATGSGRQ